MTLSRHPATDIPALAARVRRVATERGLTLRMNDTKWRELCLAMCQEPTLPSFRIHTLLAPPESVTEWDSEWFHHPYPYIDIQWMEIRPAAGRLVALNAICERLGISVEQKDDLLRVHGWTKS